MKHIKIYEEFSDDFMNKDKNDPIKKYIIWKFTNEEVVDQGFDYQYEIIMLTHIDYDLITKYWVRTLYRLVNNEIEFVDHYKNEFFSSNGEADENIIYTSDSLEDCLDRIKIISKTINYNL